MFGVLKTYDKHARGRRPPFEFWLKPWQRILVEKRPRRRPYGGGGVRRRILACAAADGIACSIFERASMCMACRWGSGLGIIYAFAARTGARSEPFGGLPSTRLGRQTVSAFGVSEGTCYPEYLSWRCFIVDDYVYFKGFVVCPFMS